LVALIINKHSYKKKQWGGTKQKEEEREKNLSPRNRKACHRSALPT
jgi:hypothetical protein